MITDKITNYTDTGSSHPVDPSFLVQEYEALLNAFRKNPDQQTAQNLYNFLNAHQAELEQIATSTDYDPFPLPVSDPSQEITGETNALLQDLKAYLGGNQSVLPACFEWAKDLESWMGANTNPADVLKEFESLTQAFEQTGNPEIEKMLKTMLNTPGYEKALSLFAKDQPNFKKTRRLSCRISIQRISINSSAIFSQNFTIRIFMQIQPIPSAWQQELALYEEIAGNNQDPLEDIAAQLQSLSPDWTKISADLGQIKTDLQNMIAIVKQNPGMDRNGFLDDLNKALNFVTTLQSQEGDKQTFASSFQNLCAELTDIKQLILRG